MRSSEVMYLNPQLLNWCPQLFQGHENLLWETYRETGAPHVSVTQARWRHSACLTTFLRVELPSFGPSLEGSMLFKGSILLFQFSLPALLRAQVACLGASMEAEVDPASLGPSPVSVDRSAASVDHCQPTVLYIYLLLVSIFRMLCVLFDSRCFSFGVGTQTSGAHSIHFKELFASFP